MKQLDWEILGKKQPAITILQSIEPMPISVKTEVEKIKGIIITQSNNKEIIEIPDSEIEELLKIRQKFIEKQMEIEK